MADTWIPLPIGERRSWLQGVSLEARVNCFQLASTHGSLDGPWSYALFVLDPAHPEILTAYFAMVHPEALEGGFNPLDGGGGISLTQEEGRGLIVLLETQMDNLIENQGVADPAFQLLKEEEYADLHLVSIASSYNSLEEYFYRQVRPHGEKKGNNIVAVLLFGQDRVPHRGGLYFKALQFRSLELENPDFRPRDYALPRIHLDKADIRSLVTLFQRFLA